MDYFTNRLFRPALFAFSILLCLGSLVRTADAAEVCTGTQGPMTDGSGNTCTSFITTLGTASASAGSTGGNDSTATSTATLSGTATSTADFDSTATSTATNSGTATATASNFSTATSTADTSGTATSTASNHDTAEAFATLSGTATATATLAGSVVCVFATNSGTATGGDTFGGTCSGDAVVVSSTPGDSCGVAAGTPCAGAEGTPTAILGSEGAYLLSYYDVSTGFDASAGGYGGAGHSGGVGDALLRIVNAGNYETGGGPATGDVCANIYVFNDIQEMEECCQCDLSADSLRTLSVINDLLKNPFTGAESTEAGVIKIIGVAPSLQSAGPSPASKCHDSTINPLPNLAEGLHAWLNHTEQMGISAAPFGFVTSTSVEAFSHSRLDSGELSSLYDECAFINEHGSGRGICTCGFGD